MKCKFESTASGFFSDSADSLMSTYTQEKRNETPASLTSVEAERDDLVTPISAFVTSLDEEQDDFVAPITASVTSVEAEQDDFVAPIEPMAGSSEG